MCVHMCVYMQSYLIFTVTLFGRQGDYFPHVQHEKLSLRGIRGLYETTRIVPAGARISSLNFFHYTPQFPFQIWKPLM